MLYSWLLLVGLACPVVWGLGGPPRGAPGGMVYDGEHDHNHGVDSRVFDEDYNPDTETEEQEVNRLNGFRRDVEHIREHLRHKINVDHIDPETASKRELDWYFFNIHDTDDDLRLDGLELLAALGHALHHQIESFQEAGLAHAQIEHRLKRAQTHFVRQIDRILDKEDLNGDGYLNYFEYAKARTAQMIFKHADMVQKSDKSTWY